MENAELYVKYNSMQKGDIENVLREFQSQLQWSEDESVLDVGCGPGDVTAEVLYPYLPPSASLVGVDLSTKMVDYATKKYSSKNIHFRHLDFSTKNITNIFHEGQFSKLFSFYCLHWILDQEQVAKNIFTLLRPGGEFLILMCPRNPVFKVYRIMSRMKKWQSYMRDVEDFIPCLHESAHLCEDIQQAFTRQGLHVTICEERINTVTYPDINTLIKSNEAVNPFVKRMTQDIREKYMASLEQVVEENNLFTEHFSGEIQFQNPLVVVYGWRPLLEPSARLS